MTTEPKISNTTFNEKEQIIINAIYNYPEIYTYFDKDNLKSFEIIAIRNVGYYKSKENIKYMNVDYISSCYDGTYNCDNLDRFKSKLEENEYMSFWVEIDINNYSILKIMDGISISANSDWISTDYKVE